MKKIIPCLLMLSLLTGCAPKVAQSEFYAMNTIMTTQIYASKQADADAISGKVEMAINALEKEISRTRVDSEIYALNHAMGEWVSVSAQTYDAIAQAVAYAVLTEGAFDPTVATCTDLWAIGTENQGIPDAQALATARETVGYQHVELREQDGKCEARLTHGAQLDLGGIGKGLASNLAMQTAGNQDMLLLLGGNIVAWGENPNRDSKLWTVGVADPDNSTSPILLLQVTDTTVVTSGDYERYFEQDGVRYHHILDPQTGAPAQTDLRSVTVVDSNSARADALTTALFVMGLNKAQVFCAENDVDAVFVTQDKQVLLTDGFPFVTEFVGAEAGYTYAS